MLILAGPVGEREHDGGSHPERPARIRAALDGVSDLHLGSDLVTVAARAAARDDLLRVHDGEYLDELESFSRRGGGALDADTYVTDTSWDAAVRAAGAGLVAIEALESSREGVAFVAVRPPGHHAQPDRGMGFCLLNNVAVAAAALREKGQRVLIIDWDVHHGNGTQAIFSSDPGVFYVSTHQWPAYPGTGRASEIGTGPGTGFSLNIPLPPGATGDIANLAFERIVAPAAESFGPDWVLVSAGFDAHRDDPIADLAWSSGDYAQLTRQVVDMSPPGRLIAFLEGGYDLRALGLSSAATMAAMAGFDLRPEPPTAGGPGREAVLAVPRIREKALEGP